MHHAVESLVSYLRSYSRKSRISRNPTRQRQWFAYRLAAVISSFHTWNAPINFKIMHAKNIKWEQRPIKTFSIDYYYITGMYRVIQMLMQTYFCGLSTWVGHYIYNLLSWAYLQQAPWSSNQSTYHSIALKICYKECHFILLFVNF